MSGEHTHDDYLEAIQRLSDRLTALESPPEPPEPPEPTPKPVRSVLAIPGRTRRPTPIQLKPTDVPWDAIQAPNDWWHGPRAYQGTSEVVATDRPIYIKLMQYVKWMRSLADNAIPVPTKAAAEITMIANLDPIRSIYPGNMTDDRGRMPEAFNVMAGFFFAVADLSAGNALPGTFLGAVAWRDRCKELLKDPNWRANHNFRASCIVLLAATESVAPSVGGSTYVRQQMSAHVERTLYSGYRNRIEEDRQRGIHYPLIEVWSAAVVAMWLVKFNQTLSVKAESELRTYLSFLLPKAKLALAIDPKPGQTVFTFQTPDGHKMQEIGPIVKGCWGPAWEAAQHLGWTNLTVPEPLRGHTAVYKTYTRV